ncbi:MAG: hypothetical protein WEA75_05490 [Acidimicrobiia bacterium]
MNVHSRAVPLRIALVLAVTIAGVIGVGSPIGAADKTGEVAEFDLDVGYGVTGVVEWHDSLIAISYDGAVLRSSDGREWEQVQTLGLEVEIQDYDREDVSFDGLTTAGDTLIAIGNHRVVSKKGFQELTPLVWVSEDAESWQLTQTSGLDPDGYLWTAAAHDDALVFGTGAVTKKRNGIVVWASSDGVQWRRIESTHLNSPQKYSFHRTDNVAVGPDGLLAVQIVGDRGSRDDETFGIWRSTDGLEWEELDYSGLDSLDRPNSDEAPLVAAVNGGYVGVGVVDGRITLFQSSDGASWSDEQTLDDAPVEEVSAVVVFHGDLIVLGIRGYDELVVARIATSSL